MSRLLDVVARERSAMDRDFRMMDSRRSLRVDEHFERRTSMRETVGTDVRRVWRMTSSSVIGTVTEVRDVVINRLVCEEVAMVLLLKKERYNDFNICVGKY
jgi:hypothetical protein